MPVTKRNIAIQGAFEAEPLVLEMCDMVGNLMEYWGFRKVLGRIWMLLYLSPEPLPAVGIQQSLGMSVGGVSMALQELERWGVIKRTTGPVARREYYEPETDLWRMVSRVFRERERVYVEDAIVRLNEAIHTLGKKTRGNDPLARFQRTRLEKLQSAAQIALRLIDSLLATAKIDASPLRNLKLSRAFGLRRKA